MSIIRVRDVIVNARGAPLPGTLATPPDAIGLVLFVHGRGSSRNSSRNRFVAGELQKHRIATLLMDLLTKREERADEETGALQADIPFLARRLAEATDWTQRDRLLAKLPLGYFGAGTGAAAALAAAAEQPHVVQAIVVRGGRTDPASDRLAAVASPTLFIVGSADTGVADLNRSAYETLRPHTETRLHVISGATHLFEEPGALKIVADLAAGWFVQHLSRQRESAPSAGAGTHSLSTRR